MKTIEDFKALPNKRQASIGMSLAILVLLIVISLGATVVQNAYLDATSSGKPAEDEASKSENEAADQGKEQEAKQGYDALSAGQKALADAYTDDERKFVEFLSASVWTADKEGKRLEFGDHSFREIEGGSDKATDIPFVISALTKTKEEASGAVIERTQAAVQTPSSSKMLEMQAVTDINGSTTYSVTSEVFKAAKTYVRGEAAQEFELKGIEGELSAVIGGSQGELERQLKEYCAVSYPTASVAAWDKRAVSDWNNGTVAFSVVLDNEKKSQVGVTYSMQEKTFAIDAIR